MPPMASDSNGFQTHFLCLKCVGPWLHFTVAVCSPVRVIGLRSLAGTGREGPLVPA